MRNSASSLGATAYFTARSAIPGVVTRKEIDVLSGLLRDESLHDIAKRMSLSHETIRVYVKRIFRKCDVRSRTGLLALLQKLSLLAQGGG